MGHKEPAWASQQPGGNIVKCMHSMPRAFACQEGMRHSVRSLLAKAKPKEGQGAICIVCQLTMC